MALNSRQLAALGVSLGLIVATAATAQTSPPETSSTMTRQQAQAEAGLETSWDVRVIVQHVLNTDNQLRPLLAQMNPQQWYDKKGAPSTYIVQWQTAQRQLNDIAYSAGQLLQKTESLSLALDTYFRLEALDVTARSLEEGAQRYASRASADQLQSLVAQNFNARERFRNYIQDLALSTEQNFKIADEEAQRCRAMISKDPSAKKTKK